MKCSSSPKSSISVNQSSISEAGTRNRPRRPSGARVQLRRHVSAPVPRGPPRHTGPPGQGSRRNFQDERVRDSRRAETAIAGQVRLTRAAARRKWFVSGVWKVMKRYSCTKSLNRTSSMCAVSSRGMSGGSGVEATQLSSGEVEVVGASVL